MIDLHLHTTASDGTCSPELLVERAWHAGIRTLSVTDHDTMAGVERAITAAATYGMVVVPGIEITTVHRGKDVHVLAYFVCASSPPVHALLSAQRRLRLERARQIAQRLAGLGAPIDVAALTEAAAAGGKSLARPQIAQALIAAGHVASVAEAFERYLGEGSPAYVPHQGASPADVVALVRAEGGVASLAHPGYRGSGPGTPKDDLIPALMDAGLDALEAYHSSHDAAAQAHYLALAARYGLAVTGGSDYHGPDARRAEFFGTVQVPLEHFELFLERAARNRERSGQPAPVTHEYSAS